MKVSVPHKLGKAQALKKIKDFGNIAPKKFSQDLTDLKIEWKDSCGEFSFRISKININARGTISVDEKNLMISGHLPLAFRFFKNKIEKIVISHATSILK